MATRMYALLGAVLIMSIGLSSAQTQDRAENAGTAAATSESLKKIVPAGGCMTYEYTNTRSNFNYTSFLGLAKLPTGCNVKDISILKQYTAGTCPSTRANNYAVPDLDIANQCDNPITNDEKATCTIAFSEAPKEAFAPATIGPANKVDNGIVCWKAPELYYFVQNLCRDPVEVTIKLTTDNTDENCTGDTDTDDGGDDVGSKENDDVADSGSGSLATGGGKALAMALVAWQL